MKNNFMDVVYTKQYNFIPVHFMMHYVKHGTRRLAHIPFMLVADGVCTEMYTY